MFTILNLGLLLKRRTNNMRVFTTIINNECAIINNLNHNVRTIYWISLVMFFTDNISFFIYIIRPSIVDNYFQCTLTSSILYFRKLEMVLIKCSGFIYLPKHRIHIIFKRHAYCSIVFTPINTNNINLSLKYGILCKNKLLIRFLPTLPSYGNYS